MFILVFTGLIFIWSIIGSYFFNWLMVAKSYHVVELQHDSKSDYRKILQETKKYRLRVFLGVLISAIITLIPTMILYGILFLGLLVSPSGEISVILVNFLLFYLLFIVGIIIILYFLIPLQIYPTILVMEPNISYIDGLKRSFKLLSGWKTKLKFMGLF
ncbi:MAG: hypothetical protein ACW967_08370 [Candidatus Hodarchaeales archaeon]